MVIVQTPSIKNNPLFGILTEADPAAVKGLELSVSLVDNELR